MTSHSSKDPIWPPAPIYASPAIKETRKNMSELNGMRSDCSSFVRIRYNTMNMETWETSISINRPYFKNSATVTHCTRNVEAPLMFIGIRLINTKNRIYAPKFTGSATDGGKN